MSVYGRYVYGVWLSINTNAIQKYMADELEKIRAAGGILGEAHEICVDIDGQEITMTIEEFKSRLLGRP